MSTIDIFLDYGSWAGAAVALAIALRTHASTSASTIRQLRRWLEEAQADLRALREVARKVPRLEERIRELEHDLERARWSVDALRRELAELRRAVESGGGSARSAVPVVRDLPAEVVQIRGARAADGEGE